jgi:hypothetical protein
MMYNGRTTLFDGSFNRDGAWANHFFYRGNKAWKLKIEYRRQMTNPSDIPILKFKHENSKKTIC